MKRKKILFICTGNTCRSTMAEGIAMKIISENKEKYGEIELASAGIHAISGMGASDNTLQVAREKGIDLSNFRAKPVNHGLIQEADIILTMTNNHKQELLRLAPEAKDKIFLLKEYILDLDGKEDRVKRAEELYKKIQEKQKHFLEKHKNDLLELEKRKKELEEELDKVITEMGNWQVKLYEETKEERLELEKLERELQNLDIPDPFGQPVDVYRQCYDELYQAINKALEKIIAGKK